MNDLIPSSLAIDQCWTVEGNIATAAPVWFGRARATSVNIRTEVRLPAGYYRLSYVQGAYKANIRFGWGVGGNWSLVSRRDGQLIDITKAPGLNLPLGRSIPNGLFDVQGYDTFEAAENAHRVVSPVTFHHEGGPLGIILYDAPYNDNVHGKPDPTWMLCSLREIPDSIKGCVALTLYNTGVGSSGRVAGGKADSNFTLIQTPAGLTSAPAYVGDPIPIEWLDNTAISQWIGPKTVGQYPAASGQYVYRYTLDLSGFDTSTVRIGCRAVADNYIADVLINGVKQHQTTRVNLTGTPALIFFEFRFVGPFVDGVNTIDFITRNIPTHPTPTALRVEWYDCVACRTGTGTPTSTPTTPTPTPTFADGGTGAHGSGTEFGNAIGSATGTISGTDGCTPETPTTGLLSAEYKALLDSLPSNPGGFGFIFKQGTYLDHQDNADAILTGDVQFVSSTLDITCEVVQIDGLAQTVFNFAVGQDFLDAFCLEVPGTKGKVGDPGDKGPQGRHGTGDGPVGDEGLAGKDALVADTFTDVQVIESNDTYDTAVVGLNLDPDTSTLEVVKARMAVPENDEPAASVSASPIYRDITFPSRSSMDGWQLFAPPGDAVAQVLRSPDIDIVKLPDGWSGSVAGVAMMKLSQLIKLIVDYHASTARSVIDSWDRQIKDYLAEKDQEARGIVADLAMELTQLEWSSPIEFCVDIEPLSCVGSEDSGDGGGGGGGGGGGDNSSDSESDSTDGTAGDSDSSGSGEDCGGVQQLKVTFTDIEAFCAFRLTNVSIGAGGNPDNRSTPLITFAVELPNHDYILTRLSQDWVQKHYPDVEYYWSYSDSLPSTLKIVEYSDVCGGSQNVQYRGAGIHVMKFFDGRIYIKVTNATPNTTVFMADLTSGNVCRLTGIPNEFTTDNDYREDIDPITKRSLGNNIGKLGTVTVRVAPPPPSPTPATVIPTSKGPTFIPASGPILVPGSPTPQVYNTGFSFGGPIGNGDPTTDWRLYSDPNLRVYVPAYPLQIGWVNEPEVKWIGVSPKGLIPSPPGTYIFRYFYFINASISGIEINGVWACDDKGIDIKVNGISTKQTSLVPLTSAPFKIKNNLRVGTNTIDFVVTNTTNSPVGLKVQWRVDRGWPYTGNSSGGTSTSGSDNTGGTAG